jgi:hypothetical protein
MQRRAHKQPREQRTKGCHQTSLYAIKQSDTGATVTFAACVGGAPSSATSPVIWPPPPSSSVACRSVRFSGSDLTHPFPGGGQRSLWFGCSSGHHAFDTQKTATYPCTLHIVAATVRARGCSRLQVVLPCKGLGPRCSGKWLRPSILHTHCLLSGHTHHRKCSL